MRKRVVLGVMALMLIGSAGCSSVPKEKEIQEDLENYSEEKFLSDGEVIDEIKIEDRDTNKKEKYDNVLCTVITEKNNISYEKEVNLTYQKYEKDWELKDLSVNDSDAWIIKPLKGIGEKDIPSTLVAKEVDVEGGVWRIEDGEVKKVSIKKQETDLKEKTDKITMEVVLDSGVEQAIGTVVAEYEFEKEWKLDSVSEKGNFKAEINADKALDIDEEKLMEELNGQTFVIGTKESDTGNIITFVDTSNQQEIEVKKDAISDFKINSHESEDKGRNQIYKYSCKLSENSVEYGLTGEITYYYDYEDGWQIQPINIEYQLDSIDITGEWTGTYLGVGDDKGKAVLNITQVEGDKITGTYSYTPNEVSTYIQPGSYNVAGTFDSTSMTMKLQAGDWITKPDKASPFEKLDITAVYYVNDKKIKGLGQSENVFEVTKQ